MIQDLIDRVSKQVVLDMTSVFEIRMSTAGECIRKMDYESQLGKGIPSVQSAFRLATGEPIHDFWRKILEKVYGPDFHAVETEVIIPIQTSDGEVIVKGHPDGALASLRAVLEVKSVSSSTFTLVKNNNRPLEAHRAQGNVYVRALGMSRCVFIYHSRDNGEFLVLVEEFDQALFDKTILKWVRVYENKKLGIISDRPYIDATGSPCFFCDFKERCYRGYAETVDGYSKKSAVDEPEFNRLAEVYSGVRKSKLASEKAEENVKQDLAVWMLDKSINQARDLAGREILLKIGSKNNPLISIKEPK